MEKVSSITDVSVIDGATGMSLQYSPNRLDKTDSANWGRYTYYKQGGNLNIEWYYDLSNTRHEWILRYTVHGGFAFYKENDRLYWNIFSGYTVPVGVASAEVEFPEGVDVSKFRFAAYRNGNQPIDIHTHSTNEIDFETHGVAPWEAFTIDVAFPKGIISESAFWKDWVRENYGYAGSAVIIVLGILFLAGYWYYTERYKKGRGIIIAQYEPPRHLRPAMAEVVVKERITEKAWPATIVDLAVRGYISIEEEAVDGLTKLGAVAGPVAFVGIFGMIGLMLIMIRASFVAVVLQALFFILFTVSFVWFARKKGGIAQMVIPKSYALKKRKEYDNDQDVEAYEREFLDMLFSAGDVFSLQAIKRDLSARQELSRSFVKLKDRLYAETDLDTQAFINGTSGGKYFGYVAAGTFFLFVLLMQVNVAEIFRQSYLLIVTFVLTGGFIWGFVRYEPRLSDDGHILKEEWLGFKLYLETAERYRMQNLTPDIFERYLPYAMIFGIEEKWAKVFESIVMQPPGWYGASPMGMAAGTSSGAVFSPVSFSSSFSSSFASAFASSSGGAGGGGGSAGGGGGGGGGGAS